MTKNWIFQVNLIRVNDRVVGANILRFVGDKTQVKERIWLPEEPRITDASAKRLERMEGRYYYRSLDKCFHLSYPLFRSKGWTKTAHDMIANLETPKMAPPIIVYSDSSTTYFESIAEKVELERQLAAARAEITALKARIKSAQMDVNELYIDADFIAMDVEGMLLSKVQMIMRGLENHQRNLIAIAGDALRD